MGLMLSLAGVWARAELDKKSDIDVTPKQVSTNENAVLFELNVVHTL